MFVMRINDVEAEVDINNNSNNNSNSRQGSNNNNNSNSSIVKTTTIVILHASKHVSEKGSEKPKMSKMANKPKQHSRLGRFCCNGRTSTTVDATLSSSRSYAVDLSIYTFMNVFPIPIA